MVESLDHLRPWMPWVASEPLTLDERRALLEGWASGPDLAYGMFVGDEVVGGCGLHHRIGEGGLEIGYWVRVGRTGRGYATAAARALVDVAFGTDDVSFVEIHHDKANVASGRVPQKLGFTLVREVPDAVEAPGECGISCEWRLRRG